jgi:hypothetical protein
MTETCESCRRRPAEWDITFGEEVFAVCRECLPAGIPTGHAVAELALGGRHA